MAIGKARPVASPDLPGSAGPQRAWTYSEQVSVDLSSKEWPLAEEGSYYVMRDPVPGTGQLGNVTATLVKTTPFAVFYNGGLLNVIPQSLRFYVTAASASSVRTQFTIILDAGNRFTSGGAALVSKNTNLLSSNTSSLVGNAGAVLATAETAAARVIDHINFRGTIDIIEDSYEIVFGGSDGAGMGGSRAATVSDFAKMTAPVVIGPNQSMLIYEWAGSQAITAITLQTSLSYLER